MSRKKLKVYIEGDAKSAEKALDGVSSKADKLKSVLGTSFKVGAVAAGAALAGLAVGMKQCIDAAAEEEKAIAMLSDSMRQHGTYSDEALKSLQEFASEQQKLTTYGDEVTISAMQQLQTFGMDIETMKQATKVAQDLAAAKGIDLNAAVQLVGKAYAGNTGTLSRYGIVLDSAKVQAEGFTYVMDEMNRMFGGAAAAEGDTYTGRMVQMKNAFGDLQEIIGFAVMPALKDLAVTMRDMFANIDVSAISGAFEAIGRVISSMAPTLEKALTLVFDLIAKIGPVLAEIFGRVGEIVMRLADILISSGMIEVLLDIGEIITTTILDVIEALVPIVEALAPIVTKILQFVADMLKKIGPVLSELASKLTDIVTRILEKIEPHLGKIFDAAGKILDAVLPILPALLDMLMPILDILLDLIPPLATLVGWFADLAAMIVGALGSALEWVIGAIGSFAGIWSSVWDAVKSVFSGVWDGIKAIYNTVIAPVVDVLKGIWSGLQSAWETAWSTLKGIVKGAVLGILNVLRPMAYALDVLNVFSGEAVFEGPIIRAIEAVRDWHEGGWIPGWGELMIPLGAFEGGEFIIPKSAAAQIGPADLEALRRGEIPPRGGDGSTYHIHFHIPGFFGSQRELDGLARKLVSEHIPRVKFATGGE